MGLPAPWARTTRASDRKYASYEAEAAALGRKPAEHGQELHRQPARRSVLRANRHGCSAARADALGFAAFEVAEGFLVGRGNPVATLRVVTIRAGDDRGVLDGLVTLVYRDSALVDARSPRVDDGDLVIGWSASLARG
jgi:hypothetical protein